MTDLPAKRDRRALLGALTAMTLAPAARASRAFIPDARANTTTPASPLRTFFIMPLKSDALAQFLPIMKRNIAASRAEPGNKAFWVFQDEDGGNTLYLFEYWKNQAALDTHNKTAHLQAVLNAGRQDFAGKLAQLPVENVPGAPAYDTRTPAGGAQTRNVLVIFTVKPEQRDTFIKAIATLVPQARNRPGNEVYDFFEVKGTPNRFIVLERWASAAAHEAGLKTPYVQKLGTILPPMLAAPMERHLLKEITP